MSNPCQVKCIDWSIFEGALDDGPGRPLTFAQPPLGLMVGARPGGVACRGPARAHRINAARALRIVVPARLR